MSNNNGFRVIDPEGGTHEYPDAYGTLVDLGDLYLNDENNKTIAIFHRWEHVERIQTTSHEVVVHCTLNEEDIALFKSHYLRLATR